MQIRLTLALPDDSLSVPVVRRVLRNSLVTLGVLDEITSDIEVALTEACTNVLKHAHGHREYEVSCCIDGATCRIEVIDRGGGVNAEGRGVDDAILTAESGRGIQLMRALVDIVRFEKSSPDGTIVYLEKRLECYEGAALTRLDHARTSGGARTQKDGADPR